MSIRKIIAAIEIIGSVVVILLSLALVASYENKHLLYGSNLWSLESITSIIIFILFILANLVGGIKLWGGKRSGYWMSIIAQLLQLISIQTPNFSYIAFALLAFIIKFSQIGLGFYTGLGFSYHLTSIPQPVYTTNIGINLIALLLLIILIVIFKTKK